MSRLTLSAMRRQWCSFLADGFASFAIFHLLYNQSRCPLDWYSREVGRMLEKMDDLTSCSLSYVASILGGKWKPFIVWYLSTAPGKRARYSELRKRIPYDISHKMFSQHLSELEHVGIIERIVVEEKPLRVDYLLTTKGVSFANVLYFIRDWGVAYGGFSEETLLRTKGAMGDGVLVYGGDGERADVVDGARHGEAECIIWQFDPSSFNVRSSSCEDGAHEDNAREGDARDE